MLVIRQVGRGSSPAAEIEGWVLQLRCQSALLGAHSLRLVVQSLSHVQLFVTPWTVAYQASLPFTISQSLLKFMSIELLILSNHLNLCHPFLLLLSIFPSIRSFPMSQLFASGGQSIAVSASALVQLYIRFSYTYTFFFIFLHMVYIRILNIVPC